MGPEFKHTGVPLKDLRLRQGTLIAGIIRDGKALIPAGGDAIAEGDKVIILTEDQRLNDLSDIIK